MVIEEVGMDEDGKRRFVGVVVPQEVVDEHLEDGLEGSSMIALLVVRHRAKTAGNVRVINHRHFPQSRIRLCGAGADHTFLVLGRVEDFYKQVMV